MKIKERNCRPESGSSVAEGWSSLRRRPWVRYPVQRKEGKKGWREGEEEGETIGQSGIK